MKSKELERLLNKFTDCLASAIGFNRIDNEFYGRPEHDAIAMISFPRRLSEQGTFLFTAWIGLRFECLAKWIDEYPEELPPTIAQPIHFLRKDRIYTEWEFSDTSDLKKLKNLVSDDLKKHAIPYIERYSRMDDLREALESPDWFNTGLNVDTRITVLAAIQFVDGDKSGAIKTLDDGIKNLEETLEDRIHQLRKRRFAMDYLRDRFIQEK